jgi:hypothetical protein
MRGRIALQKHFVRNYTDMIALFCASFVSAHATSRRFGSLEVYSGADRAQIAFGRASHCDFSVGQDVRFPPATVNLIE